MAGIDLTSICECYSFVNFNKLKQEFSEYIQIIYSNICFYE